MRPPPNPVKFLSVRDRPNTEYWITQAIILFSTILGVYLAGQAGFRIAVDFDRYQGAVEVAHLERSLQAEVEDNIATVERWVAEYKKRPMTWHDKRLAPRESHQLDRTIWSAMQYSQRTFELPADILTGIRRFYARVERQQTILFRQSQPNGFARQAMKELATSAEQARAEILPLLTGDIKKRDAETRALLD